MITHITDTIATSSFSELDNAILKAGIVADVRDLVDKGGNSIQSLNFHIEHAQDILYKKGKVIIACDMGISRSRVVALGLLIRLGWSYDKALSHIRKVANKPDINLSLLRTLSQNISPEIENNLSNNILLLGGGGFVGSHLKSYLNSSYTIHSPRSNQINLVTDTIELSQLVEREGCSTILYSVHPKSYHSSASFALSLNMLKNTLDVAREYKLRFIYISSLVVFSGNSRNNSDQTFEVDESIIPIPYGTYSESKFFGEYMIHLYAQNYGLQALIVRSSGLYGPKMSSAWLIPKLIKKALKNEPITTHKYMNNLPEFELLHIRDFCSAIQLLLNYHDLNIVHVGSSQTVSTYTLAEIIVRLCKSTSSLTLSDINDSVQNIVSKPSSVMHKLNWAPNTLLETGLVELINEGKAEVFNEM